MECGYDGVDSGVVVVVFGYGCGGGVVGFFGFENVDDGCDEYGGWCIYRSGGVRSVGWFCVVL